MSDTPDTNTAPVNEIQNLAKSIGEINDDLIKDVREDLEDIDELVSNITAAEEFESLPLHIRCYVLHVATVKERIARTIRFHEKWMPLYLKDLRSTAEHYVLKPIDPA